MGDWYRPRHLVLAVSSKIKVMCHSCIFIVFLIQCIPSHLQHNIIECMRGVYVLAKHSSCIMSLLEHRKALYSKQYSRKNVNLLSQVLHMDISFSS